MQVGTVLSLPGVALAELAGSSLDFAWIDLEHSALGLTEAQAMAIGLAAAGCEAHVRLPSSDADQLPALLDAGIDGVVAPRVESAEQAQRLVRRLWYPPVGDRGFGPRRAGRYGRSRAFWSAPENRVSCTVQVESIAGVSAASEIASVAGVDAVVVGCSDLSLELGVPQELGSRVLRTAVTEVADAAAAAGVRFGVAASGTAADVVELAGGAELLVYSADSRLYSAAIDEAVRSLEDVHAAA